MSKIIAISAGHGYNTAGKRCLKKLDANETREWYLNDRIADKVESELVNNYDCKVLRLDDTTGKKDIALSTRVKTANNAKANLYVSIHHNAGINGGKGGGTVVYHYNDDDSKAKALRLYNKVIAQTNLVGNRADKTVIGNHLYEVKKTSMICTLIENGFMDSAVDVPIILSEEHAKKTATGIVNFLVSELGLTKKVADVKPTTTTYNVVGTAIAKQSMNVRNGASTSNTTTIGCVNKNETVEVLEVLSNGWYKIVWKQASCGYAYTSNASNAYYTYTAKATSAPNSITTSTQYYPKCDKKYTTISTALASIGVNSSYTFRRKIAAKNNIGGLNGKLYTGTTTQNTEMLNLLKAGLLKRA